MNKDFKHYHQLDQPTNLSSRGDPLSVFVIILNMLKKNLKLIRSKNSTILFVHVKSVVGVLFLCDMLETKVAKELRRGETGRIGKPCNRQQHVESQLIPSGQFRPLLCEGSWWWKTIWNIAPYTKVAHCEKRVGKQNERGGKKKKHKPSQKRRQRFLIDHFLKLHPVVNEVGGTGNLSSGVNFLREHIAERKG